MVASHLHLYLRSPRMQTARLQVEDAVLELTMIRHDHPSCVHLLISFNAGCVTSPHAAASNPVLSR